MGVDDIEAVTEDIEETFLDPPLNDRDLEATAYALAQEYGTSVRGMKQLYAAIRIEGELDPDYTEMILGKDDEYDSGYLNELLETIGLN